jgi:hypothetical protein
MPAPYTAEQQLLFWAEEVVPGVAESVIGTNAILGKDFSATPLNQQTEELKSVVGYSGYQGSVAYGQYSELTFKIPLGGSGVADTAPPYFLFLPSAAMAVVPNVGTDVTVTPVQPGLSKTGSLYYYVGDQLHLYTKCKVELKKVYAKIPYAELKVVGVYTKPITDAPPTPSYTSVLKPLAFSADNTDVQIFGQTVGASSVSIDYGNKVVFDEVSDQKLIILTRDKPTIQLDFLDPGLDMVNYWDNAVTGATGAFAMQHGINATHLGRINEESAPLVDLTGPPSRKFDKAGNIAQLSVTLGLIANGANTDWSFLTR